MEGKPREPGIRAYWVAWLVLLVVTIGMIGVSHPALLILGIAIKASVIALWFMHLRYEALALAVGVVVSILFTGLLLFVLIVPDGLAM